MRGKAYRVKPVRHSSLPLANNNELTQLLIGRSAYQPPPPSRHNVNYSKFQVMIDACCGHSNVVNSRFTPPNLTEFLRDVEKSLLFYTPISEK